MDKEKEHVSVDFETFYSKGCSIFGNTVRAYAAHEDFDCYLVAVWSASEDLRFVGHPKDFDWTLLNGRTLVSHNASFDEAIALKLVEDGVITAFEPKSWCCSADLCAYLQYPRSLAGAAYALWGETVDKTVRDRLKGHNWDSIIAQGWEQETLDYATADAEVCWRIWKQLSGQWPERERKLSKITRDMGYRGVRIDRAALDSSISRLGRLAFDLRDALPWTKEYDSRTKKDFLPDSKRGLAHMCRKNGIDPPSSTAEDSGPRIEWEREHGDKHDFLRNLGNWRKANKTLKTLTNIKERLVEEDVLAYQLRYHGSEVTGRWSGGGGLNTQNLPKKPRFGVDIRSLIVPRPGHKFVICDLAQIEPRCLALLAGDEDFLRGLAGGASPYQVHAVNTMGWSGGTLKEENPQMYALSKARLLALGYGASWVAFYQQASTYGLSEILRQPVSDDEIRRFAEFLRLRHRRSRGTDEWALKFGGLPEQTRIEWCNAWLQVNEFRKSNPKVKALWDHREAEFKKASSERRSGSCYCWKLPCGRRLKYFNIHRHTDGRWVCFTQRADSKTYAKIRGMWGQKLVENACQALARSVFSECLERVHDAGHSIVMQIHDELVCEVAEAGVDDAVLDIRQAMSISPEWAPNLPIAAEAVVAGSYQK